MSKMINRALVVLLLTMIAIMISCKQEVKVKNAMEQKNYVICDSFVCLQKHKNKQVNIKGKLRKFTPNKSGKGAGHMFWDWEVLLSDNLAVPIVSKGDKIDLSMYNNKNVLIKGNVFYGIVIGSPEGQNATGFRIDANSIQKQTLQEN